MGDFIELKNGHFINRRNIYEFFRSDKPYNCGAGDGGIYLQIYSTNADSYTIVKYDNESERDAEIAKITGASND